MQNVNQYTQTEIQQGYDNRAKFLQAQKDAKSAQELVEITRKLYGKLTRTTIEHQLWIYEDTEPEHIVNLFKSALKIA
jgi:hypothetical protein